MYHLAVTFIWTVLVFLIYLALYLFCTYGVWRFKDSGSMTNHNCSSMDPCSRSTRGNNVIKTDEVPLALSIDDDSSDEMVGEMV